MLCCLCLAAMLRIDVRAARRAAVPTDGAVAPDDPAFSGLGLDLTGPVEVTGVLQATGKSTYYWRGTVRGKVRGECRRCLAEVRSPFEVGAQAVFSADPALADDPEVYLLAEPVTHIDLAEAIREEVALAAPAYQLCREACAGLCPHCGADLNLGPCECQRPLDSN